MDTQEELNKLKKYGFEDAPDRGMQIVLNGSGKILKDKWDVPRQRIHALWTGTKVSIHHDRTLIEGEHHASKFNITMEHFRDFMKYVDEKTEERPPHIYKYLKNINYKEPLRRKVKRWISTVKAFIKKITGIY